MRQMTYNEVSEIGQFVLEKEFSVTYNTTNNVADCRSTSKAKIKKKKPHAQPRHLVSISEQTSL